MLCGVVVLRYFCVWKDRWGSKEFLCFATRCMESSVPNRRTTIIILVTCFAFMFSNIRNIVYRTYVPYICTALFCVFCVFLTAAKVAHFNEFFTYYGGESSRDYVVARHIATLQEFPFVGPPNAGSHNLLQNSPLYFYVLALFVLPGSSFAFLNTVSVLLWIFSVWCVFKLGKTLFGQWQGLLAAALFGFHPLFWYRSTFLWQPDIAQAVALGGFVLLAGAYTQKKPRLLFWAVAVITIAAVLHNAVAPLVPLFFIVSALLVRVWKRSWWPVLSLFGVMLVVLVVSYASVFFYSLTHPVSASLGTGSGGGLMSLISLSTQDIAAKFFREGLGFFESFFYMFTPLDPWLPRFAPVVSVATCAVLVGALWYLFGRKKIEQRRAYWFLFVLIIVQVLAVSLLRVGGGFQYLAPVYGLCSVIIAESIVSVFGKGWMPRLAAFALCIVLLPVPFVFSVVDLNANFPAPFLTIPRARATSFAIAQTFQGQLPSGLVVEAYAPQNGQYGRAYMMDSIVLAELEPRLQVINSSFNDRFTALVQNQTPGSRLFAVCYDDTKDECVGVIKNNHHEIVASPHQVFSAPGTVVYSLEE